MIQEPRQKRDSQNLQLHILKEFWLTPGENRVILNFEGKMDLILSIPQDINRAIKLPDKEKERFLLKELAVVLYQTGALSFGKARELAHMSKWEFHHELGNRRIPRHYDLENFKEDLKYGKEAED